MRSLFKAVSLLLCMGFTLGAVAASKDAKPKEGEKKTEEKKKDPNKKKDGDKKKDPKKGGAAAQEENSGRLNLPMAVGPDSKGLKIPYYDTKGQLQMNFVIGVATRVDNDHVLMKEMQVETFNEEGESEMV